MRGDRNVEGGGTFGSTSKLPVNTGCQLKMEGKTKERKKERRVDGRRGDNRVEGWRGGGVGGS